MSRLKEFCLCTVSVAAVTTMAAVANAQESTEEDVIVVQGIRQSLEQAVDRKRNSTGLLDAIAAEDLGKFPDQNIAESLQRVPGVTIDRNGGEGQFVTVRGFGPSL